MKIVRAHLVKNFTEHPAASPLHSYSHLSAPTDGASMTTRGRFTTAGGLLGLAEGSRATPAGPSKFLTGGLTVTAPVGSPAHRPGCLSEHSVPAGQAEHAGPTLYISDLENADIKI